MIPCTDDVVIAALKKRFFAAAEREDYPHTPKATEECDHLQHAIRAMMVKSEVLHEL